MSYRGPTEVLQRPYKVLQRSYKVLRRSYIGPTEVLQRSYKVPMGVHQGIRLNVHNVRSGPCDFIPTEKEHVAGRQLRELVRGSPDGRSGRATPPP